MLRVPDDLHRRIAARAAREGRSVNQVASEILDAAADADRGDRQSQVRARARALGILREVPAAPTTPEQRRAAIESMRGLGRAVIDELEADRNRV